MANILIVEDEKQMADFISLELKHEGYYVNICYDGEQGYDEEITILKIVSIILIDIGTYMMIEKKKDDKVANDNKWLIFAIGSAVFASLTSILGRMDLQVL